MKQERAYTEFLRNEKFIRWVLNPNAESDHFWKNWIASHPESKEDFELARNFISSIEYKSQFKLDDHKYKSGLYKLMDLHEQEVNRKRVNFSLIWRSISVAAMILLALFVGLQLQQAPDSVEQSQIVQEIVKKTELGQKQTIRLPDGTMAHLNAGTILSYQEPFGVDIRKVHLEGEAFFDVIRDESKPFIIETMDLEIRVLGTSFNVNAYAGDSRHSVAVKSGKVEVADSGSQNAIQLNPLEVTVFSEGEGLVRSKITNPLVVFGWVEKKMIFDNRSLEEVFKKISKWYGVQIEINIDLGKDKLYTANYDNPTLTEVMDVLAFVYDFEYKVKEKIITIQ